MNKNKYDKTPTTEQWTPAHENAYKSAVQSFEKLDALFKKGNNRKNTYNESK